MAYCLRIFGLAFALSISSSIGLSAADTLKLEAQLIWATNEKTSPNPKHQTAESEVAEKLERIGLKWKHFFENPADRKQIALKQGATKRVTMSPDCEIEVKYLGNSMISVTTIGKGRPVNKSSQSLPKGEVFAIGGPIEDHSAWFIILKQEP